VQQTPAVCGYHVLVEAKDQEHQSGYGVPATVQKEEPNNYMP
jgi:hypothetical protein